MKHVESPDAGPTESQHSALGRQLFLLGTVSLGGYVALSWLSRYFSADVPDTQRPTLSMLLLFAGEFFCYWAALWLAVRMPPSKKLVVSIVGFACLFRAVMLPSVPMHEVDIYRYLWDGAVLSEGVSPYRYAPQEVLDAISIPCESLESDLSRLVALRETHASLANILGRIHYGEYPSPYPSVSQLVFAVGAQITPSGTSPYARVVIMKGLLVLCDLATLLLVIALLKKTGRHVGWSLAYGWCPLLLKEIANGGHLDSIAMMFCTAAVWLEVRGCARPTEQSKRSALVVGFVLALAIGAKLYPVVLLPWFVILWWRRGSASLALVCLVSTVIAAIALLFPMFLDVGERLGRIDPPNVDLMQFQERVPGQLLTPAMSKLPQREVDPSAGIRAFLRRWEMNDLVFMVVLENLRPQTDVEPHKKPWFVLMPAATARSILTGWAATNDWLMRSSTVLDSPGAIKSSSFSLARLLTGSVFGILACWLAWRAAGQGDPLTWCRAAMLMIAWFWLTCPTQNPWYWCWVLPLLPFAQYRTWFVVGAMTLMYYLRFWLTAHFSGPPTLGTPYDGEHFFYFVVPWIEFLPCLLALAFEWGICHCQAPRLHDA